MSNAGEFGRAGGALAIPILTLVDKALAAGGSEVRPQQDFGFMMSRAFADLDGHIWEILWMAPAAIQS